MTELETIRTKLKGILDTLVDSDKLAVVYDHQPSELKQFPCATMKISNFENEIFDTASQKLKAMWKVRVYAKASDKSQSESDIVKNVGNFIEAINQNSSLDLETIYTVVRSGEVRYTENQLETVYMEMEIESELRINR